MLKGKGSFSLSLYVEPLKRFHVKPYNKVSLSQEIANRINVQNKNCKYPVSHWGVYI